MRLLQYEKLQEVVSVISGLSIKCSLHQLLSAINRFLYWEGLLWLFLFI